MRRLLALGLAAGLVACQRAPAAPKAARHVVIVTIDTLRADRLCCYGARDMKTPRLDRIAAQGALAVEASAHAPLTRPSHVSLFTGLLPTEHGIRDNVSPAVVPQVPLLAELFRKGGFATGAFVSAGPPPRPTPLISLRQGGRDSKGGSRYPWPPAVRC